MDSLGVCLQDHLFTYVRMYEVPWGPFSLLVGSLTFVNGLHQWPMIKWYPPCLTSTTLFIWLGFIPLGGLDWRPWANSSILIFFYCSSYTIPCHISYDASWYIDPPCVLVAMICYWAWIHIVHLCPWVISISHGATLYFVWPW